jgi:hypothetical protein
LSKEIVKLSVIRKTTEDSCPFGLSVPTGCANAGDSVTKMAPISILGEKATNEEKNDIKEANIRLFNWSKPCDRCIYANELMTKEDAVNCSYNEKKSTDIGELNPAPYYSKVYDNTAIDGLNSIPIGYYADYDISRNLFYGTYSINSNDFDGIKRFANYLEELNNDFNSLDDNYKNILKNFAKTYANNSVLLKMATNISEIGRITVILNCWKDTNESR